MSKSDIEVVALPSPGESRDVRAVLKELGEAVNGVWAKRGRACRDRRVIDGPYRTMKQLAALVGIPMVTLSNMENGKIDPTALEQWWAGQDE